MVRFKNRWLLLSVHSPSTGGSAGRPTFGPSSIVKALRHSIARNFGDVGSGALAGSVACRYAQPKTGMVIVRCARNGASEVMAAAAMVPSLDGRPVRICVRWCGGTIKKVQLKCIALSKAKLLVLQANKAAQARGFASRAAMKAAAVAAQEGGVQPDGGAVAAAAALDEEGEVARLDVDGAMELEQCKADISSIKQ